MYPLFICFCVFSPAFVFVSSEFKKSDTVGYVGHLLICLLLAVPPLTPPRDERERERWVVEV